MCSIPQYGPVKVTRLDVREQLPAIGCLATINHIQCGTYDNPGAGTRVHGGSILERQELLQLARHGCGHRWVNFAEILGLEEWIVANLCKRKVDTVFRPVKRNFRAWQGLCLRPRAEVGQE